MPLRVEDAVKRMTRREWIIMVGGSALAVALGARACSTKKEIQTPLDLEFYKRAKELLREGELTNLPLRMTISEINNPLNSLDFKYRNSTLQHNLLYGPMNADEDFVVNSKVSKSFELVDDDFINIPDTGLAYAFELMAKTAISGDKLTESYISKLKIFDPGTGKGVLFTWTPNSPKNSIELEKEIYINPEAPTQWPWRIDLKTMDYTVPDNINISPTTIWHPSSVDDQQRQLSQLVNDWENLIKTDFQGSRNRLDLMGEFAQKAGQTVKDLIKNQQ